MTELVHLNVRPLGELLREINKSKQMDANENPWYVLATIYGEHFGSRWDDSSDIYLQNRRIWNSWACRDMSTKEKRDITIKYGLAADELQPWTEEEEHLVNSRFLGKSISIPNPRVEIDFSMVVFQHTIVFKGFLFVSHANFQQSVFNGYANFRKAVFFKKSSFNTATFKYFSDFSNVRFIKEASFRHAVFKGSVDFRRAVFRNGAFFQGGEIIQAARFDNAKFSNSVPNFYNRRFHQDARFSTNRKDWPIPSVTNAENGKVYYTRLRSLMSELHKVDDEHFFFRQEMRCKAFLGCWLECLPVRLYGRISDLVLSDR